MSSVPSQEHYRRFFVSQEIYPFADHWYERAGVAMHYVDEGEGLPVLMLHGNPTWSFLYRDVIQALDGRCRCIAPDYPGFGFSEHPPGYGYTPQEHADWVAALVEELNLERYLLVVQDWGGPIGLAAALRRPERLAGLLLLNTWAWAPDLNTWLFSQVMGSAPARYLHLQRNFFARRLVPAGIHHKERRQPEVLRAYTDPFPTPDSRLGTWVFPWSIRNASEWLRGIERQLPRLKDKPVEVVWAMRDLAFGHERFIEHWLRYFPNAPVDRIADAGHYLQEDRPDRVAAGVLRLLQRVEAGELAKH